jgi:hypothetical protein
MNSPFVDVNYVQFLFENFKSFKVSFKLKLTLRMSKNLKTIEIFLNIMIDKTLFSCDYNELFMFFRVN